MGKTRDIKYNTVSRNKRRMDSNSPIDKGDILTIDPSMLDDRFEYYWCDEGKPGNLAKKESKDWDIVKDMTNAQVGDKEAGTPAIDGSIVSIPGGSNGGNLVLMSKKKEWCEEDRNKMEKHLQQTEAAMHEKNDKKFDKVKE